VTVEGRQLCCIGRELQNNTNQVQCSCRQIYNKDASRYRACDTPHSSSHTPSPVGTRYAPGKNEPYPSTRFVVAHLPEPPLPLPMTTTTGRRTSAALPFPRHCLAPPSPSARRRWVRSPKSKLLLTPGSSSQRGRLYSSSQLHNPRAAASLLR
jgi:hypothetical protein